MNYAMRHVGKQSIMEMSTKVGIISFVILLLLSVTKSPPFQWHAQVAENAT